MKICGLGDKVMVNSYVGILNEIRNEKITGATIPYIVVGKHRINICEIEFLEKV